LRDDVPETVVAARPDDPGVASLDLICRQRDAAIHVTEEIFVRRRKGRRRTVGDARLVKHRSRLAQRRRAANEPEKGQRQRNTLPSDTADQHAVLPQDSHPTLPRPPPYIGPHGVIHARVSTYVWYCRSASSGRNGASQRYAARTWSAVGALPAIVVRRMSRTCV